MGKNISVGLICFLLFGLNLNAQNYKWGYLVEFTDKENSEYSIDKPEDYLSDRAIERRLKWNISITEQDLPVNQSYIDSVSKFATKLHVRSKWMNSAVFFTDDSLFVESASNVSIVKSVKLVFENTSVSKSSHSKWNLNFDDAYYGEALNQIEMCAGQVLHNDGFMGEGMQIAVLDGGFWDVNNLSCFDSLFANNQVLDTWDFVEQNENVYDDHTHGMSVLSIMASHLPYELIGTAPKASYYLFRTENVYSEYLIEEENWIAGAEQADSAGADIITASLGYSIFDNPEMDHTYMDMNGVNTRITQGAEIAFSKGMFVVNSAGNEGNNDWKYITAPSDGEHVLCIGAVDETEQIAFFSSYGPSFDQRTKPDVVAKGLGTFVIRSDGSVGSGNGTSYSGPVMAGFVACLWEALPNYSNQELLDLIRSISDRFESPDNRYGYGLPDFSKVAFMLDSAEFDKVSDDAIIKTYPNPFDNEISFHLYIRKSQTVEVSLLDGQGNLLMSEKMDFDNNSYNLVELDGLAKFSHASYILRVTTEQSVLTQKIVRN